MVNATICPEDKTNADPAGKERINAEEPEIKGCPCGKGYTTPPSTFAAVSVKFWIRHWMNCSGRNKL